MHPEVLDLQMTITAGSILIVLSIGTSSITLWYGLKRLLAPLFIRFDEHDILWEDYSIKRGRTYRRSRGRGHYLSAEDDAADQ